ncbi:uncharacterized protein LOC127007316 isoform X1 [Eriocheir sinensis]|uniref:uncharacterized protein LOC127007316 isoform X1 n=1 Tax=Eriocheir sinensis TaxID=95602 RepID=UPI0021C786EC|nr:uncharacterized protein LOC127007316 isoform X1 [Eriocheir sinensis]
MAGSPSCAPSPPQGPSVKEFHRPHLPTMLTNLHLLHLRVVRCSRASPYLPSPASFCLTLLSSFALGFLERCCLGLFEPSVMMVGSKAQAGAEPHSGEEWPWLTTVLSASHSCRSPRTHSYAACSSDVTCSRHGEMLFLPCPKGLVLY